MEETLEQFVRRNELRANDVIKYIKENHIGNMTWPETMVFTATLTGALLSSMVSVAESQGEKRDVVVQYFFELLSYYTQQFDNVLKKFQQ
jgi:hypothetical protein